MNKKAFFMHIGIYLLAVLLLSACTQFEHYRTDIPDTQSANYVPFKCKVDESLPGLVDKDMPGTSLGLCENSESAGSQAIQHRYYQSWSKPEVEGKKRTRMTGDYHLSFVEFDDQGWFADRRQMDALFGLLDRLEEQNDGSTLIYVYAHGWKHNASSCDNNVICFSRLLERTDLVQRVQAEMVDLENPPPPRNVVGVYIGWRGLPFNGVLNNLSFWSRKDAAERVGRGGVFELLTRLKDYRDNRFKDYCVNQLNHGSQENLLENFPDCAKYDAAKDLVRTSTPSREPTQLVITGHSFGGQVIYSALSHALMERAAKTSNNASGLQYERAESFGDFVMLVNPAFEGSIYEPLFQIATNRCYDPEQKPVMAIVTSEADDATGKAFPLGQTLGRLFQHAKSSEQKDSMRKSIGHNDRYLTHRLSSDGIKAKEVEDQSPCPCKFLEPTSDVDVETKLLPLFATNFENAIGEVFGDTNPKPYGKEVLLAPAPWECSIEDETFQACFAKSSQSTLIPKYTNRYPYLVVSTDAGVIADHNAIYNERFTDFTMAFIARHITAQPHPWTPAAASSACSSTQRYIP